MPSRSARVCYESQTVGTLEERDRELYFTYSDDWLAHPDRFPISVNLPFGSQPQYAHPFFSGLLPEGNVRQRVCRQRAIDVRDDTGLLFAIGEDCAGALSIVSDETTRTFEAAEPLTTDALENLARARGALDVGKGQRRFSLAGAQEKQPVIFANGQYSLPNRECPSTHILKFETVPGVCFAEAIANALARKVGLQTVNTEHLQTQDEAPYPYLRIERYDRRQDDERVRRLHQEDLLQALGEPTALKYQSDGGPGLSQIAALLATFSAEPSRAMIQLRDWQMFNYLIGNWDGHAKNLALLYPPGQAAPLLAPFYDLVAIEYLNVAHSQQWARKMAFRIGANDEPERVTLDDWRQFSRDLSIPIRPTLARLRELAALLPDAASHVVADFVEHHGESPVYGAFRYYISKRCRWVERQLKNP